MKIIPSIFTTTENQFREQITSVGASAPCVHIDVTDSEFVPTQTFADPKVTVEILQTDCELHLMVTDPLKVLPKWAEVKNVKRILFHYEAETEVNTMIEAIHAQGWVAGLVLNPHTPWRVIEPFAEKLDAVMFMGVVPGAQGQSLIPAVLEKAKEFKTKYPRLFTEWDGAVTEETIKQIQATGIDVVCPGHAVFGSGDPVQNIKKLQQIIK